MSWQQESIDERRRCVDVDVDVAFLDSEVITLDIKILKESSFNFLLTIFENFSDIGLKQKKVRR